LFISLKGENRSQDDSKETHCDFNGIRALDKADPVAIHLLWVCAFRIVNTLFVSNVFDWGGNIEVWHASINSAISDNGINGSRLVANYVGFAIIVSDDGETGFC